MKKASKIIISLMFSINYIIASPALAQTASIQQPLALPTLFVISSPAAVVQKQENGFTLSLNSPDVTYFTDRPYRKAGDMSNGQFIKLWSTTATKDSFKANPPNAFVTGLNTSVTAKDSQVIVLSNPKVASDSMTFKIKQIGGHHSLETGKLGRTTVFIDFFSTARGAHL